MSILPLFRESAALSTQAPAWRDWQSPRTLSPYAYSFEATKFGSVRGGQDVPRAREAVAGGVPQLLCRLYREAQVDLTEPGGNAVNLPTLWGLDEEPCGELPV